MPRQSKALEPHRMTPPATLSAPEFQALCALLWGEGWRPSAAEALGVGLRNVQFWAAEPPARSKPVPAGVAADLVHEVRVRLADPGEAERMAREVARLASQVEILKQVIAFENQANDS